MLKFGVGDVLFSTESGIGFNENFTAELNFPSQIGNTGLIIDLDNAKLDISRQKNIPEANLDGRPNDFVGVYIEQASITLPEKWFKNQPVAPQIFGKNLLIGTGGISGTIGLSAQFEANLGKNDGFTIGFTSFDITFRQNEIISSNIRGYLIIQGFKDSTGNDAKIDIHVNIGKNGDFKFTASEEDGIEALEIPDILKVNIKSLEVGRKSGVFYLAVSGLIDFADQTGKPGGNFIKDNLPKDVEIQKLVIYSNGKLKSKEAD